MTTFLIIVGCFILTLVVFMIKGVIANKQTVRPHDD